MDMAHMKKETFFSFIYRKIYRSTPPHIIATTL